MIVAVFLSTSGTDIVCFLSSAEQLERVNSWIPAPHPPGLNFHKWWLSQVKRPEWLSLWLMSDLLFNNVCLCPGLFMSHHLVSDCSLSFHLFFLLYCPLFQHPPVLSVLSSGRRGAVFQIECVRAILLVWSLRLAEGHCDGRALVLQLYRNCILVTGVKLGLWRKVDLAIPRFSAPDIDSFRERKCATSTPSLW